MRVLMVTPSYPNPGSPLDGLFNAQQARALRRAGVDVDVVLCKPWLPDWAARHWRRYRHLADLLARERRDGISVLCVRYLHVPDFRLLPITVRALARSVQRAVALEHCSRPYDLIHIQSSWPTGLAGPLISERLGIPFIVTLHIEDDARLYSGRPGRRMYQRMFKRAGAVTVVGTPLERFAQELMGQGVDTPLAVIPNGIDLRAVHRALRSTAPPGNGAGHIISVSSLVPIKGIDYNLRALASLDRRGLRSWRYTVVGGGPEQERLTALAQDLELADRVTFTGPLPHGEVLRSIARADIFSLPSWREAFGVVYLEAMACGRPVIGCCGQGAEDLVDPETNGLLVKPRDVASLADALERLLRQPQWTRRLGDRARRRARDFTWKRNAAATLAVYRSL